MTDSADFNAYLREAASWDADRVAQAHRASRAAQWVAIGFGVLALCALAALVLLMPLKRVEPYLIRVDNTTGVVDIVPAFTASQGVGPLVTRYLLTHYVSVCERYVAALAEQDYAECGAFNSSQRNQAWAAAWARSNPDSPLNRYRDGTTVRAELHSLTFFDKANGAQELAQARFTRILQPGGTGAPQLSRWLATLRYEYGGSPQDPQLRRWNPLGLRILDYRLEQETGATLSMADAGAR